MKEASYKTQTNWVCINGNLKCFRDNKCMARCFTRPGNGIKLARHEHNHQPAAQKPRRSLKSR